MQYRIIDPQQAPDPTPKVRTMVMQFARKAAAAYGVGEKDILGKSRTAPIVEARDWVMFELHLCGLGNIRIGREIGRDPSSVFVALRREAARRGVALHNVLG